MLLVYWQTRAKYCGKLVTTFILSSDLAWYFVFAGIKFITVILQNPSSIDLTVWISKLIILNYIIHLPDKYKNVIFN